MFRCVIIDDEFQAQDYLEKLIERYFPNKMTVLKKCDTVKDGVAAIKELSPDIVFLDIQMPNENGLKLFDYFEHVKFETIFTTAFKDFAIDAIKKSVHDYLMKPIHYLDLIESIKRLENKTLIKQQQNLFSGVIENINISNNTFDKIAFPTEKGLILEKVSNIIYCVSQSNYTEVYLFNGNTILVSKTLKLVEEMLPKEIFFSEFELHNQILENGRYLHRNVQRR